MSSEKGRRVRPVVAALDVVTTREADLAILTLVGEARLEVVHTLEDAATKLLAAGVRRVILDCGGLAFMDSASIGVFLRLEQQLQSLGGRLVVCSLGRVIERMFEATGISVRFVIAPHLAAARVLALT